MSSVADAPELGQAHQVVMAQAISKVESVIRENHHVMVDKVATMLDISSGSAHHIIHNMLHFHKVPAKWETSQLTTKLNKRHENACQELLEQYKTDDDSFLQCIVTE
jgi:hypothetical protein